MVLYARMTSEHWHPPTPLPPTGELSSIKLLKIQSIGCSTSVPALAHRPSLELPLLTRSASAVHQLAVEYFLSLRAPRSFQLGFKTRQFLECLRLWCFPNIKRKRPAKIGRANSPPWSKSITTSISPRKRSA